MKRKLPLSAVFLLIVAAIINSTAVAIAEDPAPRVMQLFDQGWKFHLGDVEGAKAPAFDDAQWQRVDLPHDWSIQQAFDSKFASGTGFLPGGIGWYRKSFNTPPLTAVQHARIVFDGVYKNAEVWINGHSLGKRPNGFIGFDYDLTTFLAPSGRTNFLAVRVDHSDFADSRFYTGSGIYRHVSLQIENAAHIARWGTFVSTTDVSKAAANVKIATRVINETAEASPFTLASTITDENGKTIAQAESTHTIEPGKEHGFEQTCKVPDPALWSPEAPHLYAVVSRLQSGSTTVDEERTSFGIRTFSFDPEKGFFLNGVKTVFKGVCVHQDAGAFGAAVPEDAVKRRLQLLKELGCNAIRSSHNPPAPEFLDLCDQMGFLVMDEAFDEWARPKKKWVAGRNMGQPSFDGYAKDFDEWSVRDVQAMVERDKNHPSIVLWSIGNEIDFDRDPYYDPTAANYTPDKPSAADLVPIAKRLSAAVKQIDSTRPVTAALATIEVSNRTGLPEALDIVGYNYQEKFYAQDHAKYPQRKIIGSENSHTLDAWKPVEELPYANGQFLWTGIDYLGESPRWPVRGSTAGVLDECGFRKPGFYFRQSLWSEKPMVYLAVTPPGGANQPRARGRFVTPNWTWPSSDGQPVTVVCYTNCPQVELYLNGKSLGQKSLSSATDRILTWQVPYAAGTLKAVASQADRQVASCELKTAGSPNAIQLKPDRTAISADGHSLCFIEAGIVDADVNPIFAATNELRFEIEGPGRIVALDSGDQTSHEDFRAKSRKAYQGRCLAIIQSTADAGTITVKASAADLAPAQIAIQSSR